MAGNEAYVLLPQRPKRRGPLSAREERAELNEGGVGLPVLITEPGDVLL
jgi:hypothetical protein